MALVANIAGRDMGSTTGINLYQLQQEIGLNPWAVSPAKVRQALVERELGVPVIEEWRLPLLENYLKQRHQMELNVEDTTMINDLIDSLCRT